MEENISVDSYMKAKNDYEAALKLSQNANIIQNRDINTMTDAENAHTAALNDASSSAQSAMIEIKEHLAKKQVKSGKFEIQFLLSADGKSFEAGYSGVEYIFEDGKIYSSRNSALGYAYRNQKIESTVAWFMYEARK